MKNPLLAYKIGFAALGVFTAVLLVLVLAQAGSVKKDEQTYKAANKIAEQLNDYVYDEEDVPETLSEAGITDVPEAVSYKKLSDEKYEFCVTYKATSSGFDAGSTGANILYGDAYDDYYDDSGEAPPSLYLETTHKKGKNCQTVFPYFYSEDEDDEFGPSGTDDPYQACDDAYDASDESDAALDIYFDCLDKVDAAESTRVD